MGLKLIDAVFKSDLPANERPYALVYARKADDDGTRCWPGTKFVADALGVEQVTVRKYRKKLIDRGVLEAEELIVHGRKHVNVLAFHAECLPPRGAIDVARRATTSAPLPEAALRA